MKNADKGLNTPTFSIYSIIFYILNLIIFPAPPKAIFAHRLAMVILFAHGLLQLILQVSLGSSPPIDIGVIKHARFVDKATALRLLYPHTKEDNISYCFDTLKRLLDPRYYGELLHPLFLFFEGDNRISCYFSPICAEWKREQGEYHEDIERGGMQDEGCCRE